MWKVLGGLLAITGVLFYLSFTPPTQPLPSEAEVQSATVLADPRPPEVVRRHPQPKLTVEQKCEKLRELGRKYQGHEGQETQKQQELRSRLTHWYFGNCI